MPHRLLLPVLLLAPSAVAAQVPGPLAAAPVFAQTWEPARLVGLRSHTPVRILLQKKDRVGNAALGGAIGAVAGVVFCTVVSNIAKDAGTGFSTCTTKGYLLTGGIGFGLGALAGLLR